MYLARCVFLTLLTCAWTDRPSGQKDGLPVDGLLPIDKNLQWLCKDHVTNFIYLARSIFESSCSQEDRRQIDRHNSRNELFRTCGCLKREDYRLSKIIESPGRIF
ncbi:hypothetical protein AVEN_6561-1 [Araneus ventricosus]|uniref:Secreted protein n=1 Tax=Araneus ventricosus TaxID=182803 RepID=A0A4Y2N6R2_ARAVE|nr:hypothetical protein AVEN_6561-1 [Araneus ventricosus]